MSPSPDKSDTEVATEQLLDLLLGPWRSRCLYVGVRLDLPEHLREPVSISRLTERTGVPTSLLRRLLRVWADLGIVEHDTATDLVYLAAGYEILTGSGGLSDLVRLYEEDFRPAWTHLERWALTGQTGFHQAYGMPIHQRIEQDPDFASRFLKGMAALDMVFHRFADLLARRHLGEWTFLDIGGGGGTLTRAITTRVPDARGTVFDLPHVLATTARTERVELRRGDMFADIPGGFDAYLLSRVLQDWDTGPATEVLANIRRAAADSMAPLWVLERTVGPGRAMSNLWDIHLGCVASGRERTRDEYLELFRSTGWDTAEVLELPAETDAYLLLPA